jgi:hypothetical protein
VTRLCGIFAYWVIVSFGQFFWKWKKLPKVLAYFLPWKKLGINLAKQMVGQPIC